MSRKIDISNPETLSDADLRYLIEREPLPRAVQAFLDANPARLEALSLSLAEGTPLEDQVHTGTVNTAGLTQEQYDRAVELLRDEESQGEDEDEDEADDADAESEDYDEGWNNDQRRAELSRRGLPVEGVKEELIARLLADDAEED